MQDDLFARPSPSPSLFFALLPAQGDHALLDEALQLMPARFGQVVPVMPGKRHVTLLYLGQPLDEQIPSLVNGAQQAVAACKGQSFVLTLDQVAVFGRNSVVLAASHTPPALASLEAQLRVGAVRNRLLQGKPPALHPHLTLGHNDGRRTALESWPPLRLAFDRFVLLRGGARDAYFELASWPLD